MKQVLAFLAIFLFYFTLSCPGYAQPVTFQKLYGGQGAEYVNGAVPTSDSGYAIAGVTSTFGAGGIDYYLVRLDKEGSVLWSKTYGGQSDDFDPSFSPTADGGFVFLGATQSFGSSTKAYVVKADKMGDVVWSKTFSGIETVYGSAIGQTSDGGLLLGITNVTNFVHSAKIIKTDSNGNTLWAKTLSNCKWLYFIQQTSDGGYVVTGEVLQSNGVTTHTYIFKMDSAGTVSWGTQLSTLHPFSLEQTSDGGYIIAHSGLSSSPGGLVKLDSIGNVVWNRQYSSDIFSVKQTSDGGYIATGDPDGFADALLIKTDSTGEVLWSKIYAHLASERGGIVLPTADGGYFMAAEQYSVFSPNSSFYLVKTDSLGDSGCFQSDISIVDSLYPLNFSSYSPQITTATIQSQSVATTVGTGGTLQTLCTSIVSVKETETKAAFHIYPNPATDVLFIETPSKKNEQVKVANVLGITQEVPFRRNGAKIELDLHALPIGFYIVNYTAEGRLITRKFCKNSQ